jgi:hypothetical protein
MAAILAQMDGDTPGASRLTDSGGIQRVRI